MGEKIRIVTPSDSAFESIVAAARLLTRAEAETLLANPDLVSVGMLVNKPASRRRRSARARRVLLVGDQPSGDGADGAGESDWSEHLRR